MVYHFVKHIGIDVEADSLEQATEFACDLDSYDEHIEDVVLSALENSDFADDIYDCDAHTGYTDYVGYTEDADEDDPEERLYDYLTTDDEDDDNTRYVLTDKGRDYLAYCKGERSDFDEANYDDEGNHIPESIDHNLHKLIKGIVTCFLDF